MFSAPNRSKGVLGGVITLHKEKEEGEEENKEEGYKMRLESFVFSQTGKPARKPEEEPLPDDKHTGDAR